MEKESLTLECMVFVLGIALTRYGNSSGEFAALVQNTLVTENR